MYRKYASAIAGVVVTTGLGLSATPASADGGAMCAPRDQMLTKLGSQFSEAPVALGLASNGGVVEVLRAADGATWTIIITMPTGLSCMMAAGQHWEGKTQVAYGPKV